MPSLNFDCVIYPNLWWKSNLFIQKDEMATVCLSLPRQVSAPKLHVLILKKYRVTCFLATGWKQAESKAEAFLRLIIRDIKDFKSWASTRLWWISWGVKNVPWPFLCRLDSLTYTQSQAPLSFFLCLLSLSNSLSHAYSYIQTMSTQSK